MGLKCKQCNSINRIIPTDDGEYICTVCGAEGDGVYKIAERVEE